MYTNIQNKQQRHAHHHEFNIIYAHQTSLKQWPGTPFFRAKGQAEENIKISEAYFRDNTLYFMSLTPFFLVGIFLVLKNGGLQFTYLVYISAPHSKCNRTSVLTIPFFRIVASYVGAFGLKINLFLHQLKFVRVSFHLINVHIGV